MTRTRTGWIAALAVSALMLAACGQAAEGGDAGDTATANAPAAEATGAGEPAEASTGEATGTAEPQATGGGSADDAASEEATASEAAAIPEGERSVVHGLPGAVDTYSTVGFITNERLEAEGWDNDIVEFARTEFNPQALAQNRVNMSLIIGIESLRTVQAGGEDPAIRYVMENNNGEFILIAKSQYPTCQDFGGIRFGIHGETSATSVAATSYLRDQCGVEPTILVIPGGDNRIIALENDQLDATLVQVADWLELQRLSDPDEYVIVDSGDSLTATGAASWWVNTNWAEENYDVAVAYTGELLRTFRMIQEDPSILADAIRDVVGLSEDEGVIQTAVETYLDPDVVRLAPPDGGNTDTLQALIDAGVATDEIDPLELDDIVHPTLLDDALAYLEANG